MALTLGIDIGSTTAKAVLFSDGAVIFEKYERGIFQPSAKNAENLCSSCFL